MKIHVLGASGSEDPGMNSPAFLIDEFFLLDAGTVCLSLDRAAQRRISHVFISHAHLDHIKGIPSLVDNVVFVDPRWQLHILSSYEIIADLQNNIFNDRIWPDFNLIPDGQNPAMLYQTLSTTHPLEVAGYKIHITRVHHKVPAYGCMIEEPDGRALVYTGDTGPTEEIWRRMQGRNVKAVIADVAFPNDMEEMALWAGHLTPSLLAKEIQKMPVLPEVVYVTHIKSPYRTHIEEQLTAISTPRIQVLRDGMILRL